MSIQLEMEEMPDYLAARFRGSGVAEEIWRQFELIAEHCKCASYNKLLIDTTGAELKISLAERFLAREKAAVFAHYSLKVAVVTRPERIHPQRFGEQVAWSRGVYIKAFTDLRAAEEWLLK